ncbi:cupin domain-containing protein [Pontibacter sp. H259]|uniref:cupin domain-containing protein n=1 Tax=Pontibacter sp. H259 TaxID=3133421 RepID=UPI0030BC757E
MQIPLPYTIENKAGEKLTFTRITVKDGIEYLEAENEVQPGAGPPMHVHYKQDEGLTVVSGKMGYQQPGEEPKYAGPGQSAVFKAGTPHRFWNAGTDVLYCKGYITPPDNVVYFLSEIYKSIDRNGGRPGMYDAAFLLNRYKAEFDMLGIPGFVKNILFPVALFFGNLTGKHKRFADAPPPLYS